MNKKLIKTIVSITCGLGILGTIPAIATSCKNKENDVMIALPDNVYSFESDGQDGYVISGFTLDFLNNVDLYTECNTMLFPNQHDNAQVTGIKEWAFTSRSTETYTNSPTLIPDFITCVDMSNLESMASIGEYAFYNSHFSSVLFPSDNSFTTIGQSAFANSHIKSIDLSLCTGLTSIGNDAFEFCYYLSSVSFKNCTSLSVIDPSIFEGCINLREVNLSGCTDYETMNNAFAWLHIESIVLPSGLTSISENAFFNCGNLTYVNFDECYHLTTIGDSAFENCSNIDRVDLSNCIALTTIGDSAFKKNTSMEELVLPNSMFGESASVGREAFAYTKSLTSIKGQFDTDSVLTNWNNLAFSNTASSGIFISTGSKTSVEMRNDFNRHYVEFQFIYWGPKEDI